MKGKLLKPKEVSALLGLLTRQIYKLCHSGNLRAMRIGKRAIRILEPSVMSLKTLMDDRIRKEIEYVCSSGD
jgi:excisionase family DNA binding protein